ncbi:MAG: transcriptional regulator, LuxR family protein, partial [Frankiales bacterium]|nr:transcriptional regulator, LuxR family protein [Frankiales bacterium]
MSGRLVEREPTLAVLLEAVARRVPVVLLSGEAGSGKSTLVGQLLEALDGTSVVGGCDSLSTARPLGPFLDWPGPVEDVVQQVDLAVVEDVHWADDATLDLLARLCRKPLPATLLLTYRDDEAGPALASLLGDLARQSPVRVAVPALSGAAVAELAAGTGVDPAALHRATGGNAFFVTECLATGSLEPSANVRDAVLARWARLPRAARDSVAAVSVVPGRCELWLADALGADAVDAAVEQGLLVATGTAVALRHELARKTVHDALPPARRRDLHCRAARALAERHPVDHTRVVHHAVLG